MCSSPAMSTSPDLLVATLSRWLAGHADLAQVREVVAQPVELGPESAELVSELRDELESADVSPPRLQPLVRETIEAIALQQ
jgi:hypothetical protein